MIPETPLAYAKKLVTYISDPSTVRVRVLEWFGRAPKLEKIQELRAQHEEAVKRRYPQDADSWYEDDEPRLRNGQRPDAYRVSEQDIALISEMARFFGLTYDDIVGDSRKRYVQDARIAIVSILVEMGCTYLRAAILVGRSEHSTSRRAYKRLPMAALTTPKVRDAYFFYRKKLRIGAKAVLSE